jgi:anti-sigma regulatory factor (Ser/Thr protein kinase)
MDLPPTPLPGGALVADTCRLAIPSRIDAIAPTVDFLTQRAIQVGVVTASRAPRVSMALHEALTNSIIHGNLELSSDLKEQGEDFARALAERCSDPFFADRTVTIQASWDGTTAHWSFTDQGPGFDVEQTLRQCQEDTDSDRLSGRGLVMMRALLDEVRFENDGRSVHLILRRLCEEKRSWSRHPIHQNVRVSPIDGNGRVHWEDSLEAVTRNISADGIALLQTHLAATPRVLITIPLGGTSVSLPAEVRHWHTLEGQILEVGCRFDASTPVLESAGPGEARPGESPPQLAALDTLVERLQQQRRQPPRERRQAPRISYTTCIQIQPIHGGPRVRGFTRDLSRIGISFVTASALPMERVWIFLPQGEGKPDLRLAAYVVRCTRLVDGFQDAAARFIHEPGEPRADRQPA